MAIYMATTKSISRGNGQSAVASASYRAGENCKMHVTVKPIITQTVMG